MGVYMTNVCPFTLSIVLCIYIVAINLKKPQENEDNKKQVNHGGI
jgi:hypothetical protein